MNEHKIEELEKEIEKIKTCVADIMDKLFYPDYVKDLKNFRYPEDTTFRSWLKTNGHPTFWLDWH